MLLGASVRRVHSDSFRTLTIHYSDRNLLQPLKPNPRLLPSPGSDHQLNVSVYLLALRHRVSALEWRYDAQSTAVTLFGEG